MNTRPPSLATDRMATARAKSHQPLGSARKQLTWAKKAIDRLQRQHEKDLAAARVRLAKSEAKVRYYEALEKAETNADVAVD